MEERKFSKQSMSVWLNKEGVEENQKTKKQLFLYRLWRLTLIYRDRHL